MSEYIPTDYKIRGQSNWPIDLGVFTTYAPFDPNTIDACGYALQMKFPKYTYIPSPAHESAIQHWNLQANSAPKWDEVCLIPFQLMTNFYMDGPIIDPKITTEAHALEDYMKRNLPSLSPGDIVLFGGGADGHIVSFIAKFENPGFVLVDYFNGHALDPNPDKRMRWTAEMVLRACISSEDIICVAKDSLDLVRQNVLPKWRPEQRVVKFEFRPCGAGIPGSHYWRQLTPHGCGPNTLMTFYVLARNDYVPSVQTPQTRFDIISDRDWGYWSNEFNARRIFFNFLDSGHIDKSAAEETPKYRCLWDKKLNQMRVRLAASLGGIGLDQLISEITRKYGVTCLNPIGLEKKMRGRVTQFETFSYSLDHKDEFHMELWAILKILGVDLTKRIAKLNVSTSDPSLSVTILPIQFHRSTRKMTESLLKEKETKNANTKKGSSKKKTQNKEKGLIISIYVINETIVPIVRHYGWTESNVLEKKLLLITTTLVNPTTIREILEDFLERRIMEYGDVYEKELDSEQPRNLKIINFKLHPTRSVASTIEAHNLTVMSMLAQLPWAFLRKTINKNLAKCELYLQGLMEIGAYGTEVLSSSKLVLLMKLVGSYCTKENKNEESYNSTKKEMQDLLNGDPVKLPLPPTPVTKSPLVVPPGTIEGHTTNVVIKNGQSRVVNVSYPIPKTVSRRVPYGYIQTHLPSTSSTPLAGGSGTQHKNEMKPNKLTYIPKQ